MSGLSAEIADSFVESEPTVDLDQGTVDGEKYQESSYDTSRSDYDEEEFVEEEVKAEEQSEERVEESKTVPIDALHAERKRRQELEATMHNMESRFQRLMQEIQSRQQVPEQPQESPEDRIRALGDRPDQFDDPQAYDEWNTKAQAIKDEYTQDRIKSLESQINEQREATAFNETMVRVQSVVRDAEKKARSEHPEYDQAISFLRNKYIEGQRASGRVGTDEQFIHEAMKYETLAATQMVMNGQNPAEVILRMAADNGFTASEVKSLGENGEKLDRIDEAQRKNKGSGPDGKAQTLESMSNMGEDDFDAAMSEFLSGVDFNVPIA